MKKAWIAVGLMVLGGGMFFGWGSIVDVGAKVRDLFNDDPDRPPGVAGDFDEADYLQRRENFVALLRGVDPSKPFDPSARIRANAMLDKQLKSLRSDPKLPYSQQVQMSTVWREMGPNPIPNGQTQTTLNPVSGRVVAIAIDPTDPQKVYVGAAQGGVYRSLDGGATWTPLMDSAQTLAIGTLNIDVANNRLWVGTGEASGSADSYAGVGIYRIDDPAGAATLVGPFNPIRTYNDASLNPQSVPAFQGRAISKILINPANPNEMLVGVAGGVIGIGGNPPFGNVLPPLSMRGLYKMSNAGGAPAAATVKKIAVSTVDTGQGLCAFDNPCTVNRNVNDMIFDLGDTTGNTVVVWLNGINVANDGGVYRSTNAFGASPTFTQTLVTASTTTSNSRGAFCAAQLGAGNPARIYLASGEPSTGGSLCNSSANAGGLRRSTDGGATWSTELAGGGGFCAGQCFYNIGFDIVPGATFATDKLLLGGNVRSTSCAKLEGTSLDGGATAFANTDTGVHADTHVIAIAPSNSNIVYRGDDGGIWKSTDGGSTWAALNNGTFMATQFQSIAVHPTDPFFMIGGTQDNGTEKFTQAAAWNHTDDGDGGYAMIDQNATDTTNVTMYHTYFNQTGSQIGMARSTNAGTSWSFIGCSGNSTTNGIACSAATTTAVNFYAPTALGPGTPNTVYLGTDRLLRSTTTGTANTTVSQAPLTSGVPISSIGISQQDDNYRIVGLNNGAIFFTTSGSSTLTSLDPVGAGSVIPDFYVARVVFDPTNKNTVYVVLGNYSGNTNPAGSHIWKVTNLNTTPVLTPLNGTGINILPDVPVNGFVVDPLHPTNLYAGTDIGVFSSTDGGTNWLPLGTGLPRVAVFDMAISAAPRKLRIVTHGRGMWEFNINNTKARADFDGDGRTDISVFRDSEGVWYSNRSAAGFGATKFGQTGDVPVPADYDGDGVTDIAVFRADANPSDADFFILNSKTNTVSAISWGLPGDIPVVADYDGDGLADLSVWRPSDTVWYTMLSTGGFAINQYGSAGDKPMPMDTNGDGIAQMAVYRPAIGTWFIAKQVGIPAQNFDTVSFGTAEDLPVPADYDGDGKDDVAVYRPSTGTWYILQSSNAAVNYVPFGISTDVPVPGDYDGDGKADVAVYRNGTWYLNRSASGFAAVNFGLATDTPIPKKYIP